MDLVALNIDGREGTSGTKVLARTTADTTALVDHRNLGTRLIAIGTNHLDSTTRTMAGTVATRMTIGQRHTVLCHPHGMTQLRRGLLCQRDQSDSTGWANRRTGVALDTAVAVLVTHNGLHERGQIRRRMQHIVRALADTKLASRTMLLEIARRDRTRRRDRCHALGCNLIFDNRQSAIDLNLPLSHSR